jgi:hypothetical protein
MKKVAAATGGNCQTRHQRIRDIASWYVYLASFPLFEGNVVFVFEALSHYYLCDPTQQ